MTARRRADREIEESLSLLRATLEATTEGILVVNENGKIVNFNRKFTEMWRLPESVLVSRDDNQALAWVLDQLKDPEKFIKKVKELYSQPESKSYDWLEFKDGRIFERYSQPQKIGGQTVGRVWSFRDVTDRRLMEMTMKRQAQTFDHIFDGVIVTDLDGRIVDWNPGATRMFGYSKEEAVGAPEQRDVRGRAGGRRAPARRPATLVPPCSPISPITPIGPATLVNHGPMLPSAAHGRR